MIKLISSKAACFLCKEDDEETLELYEYAIYIVLSAILHIVTIVIVGVCFNMLIESIVFYGSFISIRKFAGGYHAKMPSICYIFSFLSSIIVLVFVHIIKTNIASVISSITYCTIFSMCICTAIIIFFSPLGNNNKPLNKKEVKVYKRISIINVTVLFFVSLLFIILRNIPIGVSISYGIVISAITLVMRKIQIINSK